MRITLTRRGYLFLTLFCFPCSFTLMYVMRPQIYKYVSQGSTRWLMADTKDNSIQRNTLAVPRNSNQTDNNAKGIVYNAAHLPEWSHTAKYCAKINFTVPKPSEFFRVHKHIVNPYAYSVLLTPGRAFCDHSTFAIVITMSYHSNRDRRIAIRQTWGNGTWLHQQGYSTTHATIKQVFLFGVHKDNTLNEDIKLEERTYGDILQGNFEENYRTLGYKSRMALQWVSAECPQARYIVKADDDVLVNMPKLLGELGGRRERLTMIGHCNHNEVVSRDVRHKFYSSCQDFPFDRYPIYMDGPMYVMTSDLASELFLMAQHMTDFFIDDVFTSGFLTIPLYATLKCERGYGVNDKEDKPRMPHPDKFVISASRPTDMHRVWDNIKYTSRT